ncbi:MAG: hypothetical protein ACE5EQ_02195 [Phycisphaerae bacterium]
MERVYLETSYVSATVTDRSDTASAYRRQLSTLWWREQRANFTLFITEEVLAELSHPDFRQRDDAIELIREIPLLPIDEDVRGLARILVREKVMPGPIAGDAIHVAAASVHRMEYMLTWNVRHLANVNKLEHLQTICRRIGYIPPRIVTPDLLWDYRE